MFILRRCFLLPLFALGLSACASAPHAGAPSGKPPGLPVIDIPDLGVRAMLLYLVDRQMYDPFAVEQALRAGPEVRQALAEALGRIPDRQGRSPLIGLLLDDVTEVRRAAAFGLGELEDPEASEALLRAVRDPDRETAVLAVEALGKIQASVVEVAEALLPLPEEERTARLLPHLFRFKHDAVVPLAVRGLAVPDRELHARAAYALAREPRPAALPALRGLLADPDPRVRGWAARALGIIGGGEDLAALRPLLDDVEPGPAIHALRAAARLVNEKKATAPAEWRASLAERVADPRPGVRLTALEAAGAWPLSVSDPLSQTIAARATEGTGRERGTALIALAAGGHPRAAALIAAAAGSTDADVRARAAEAIGKLEGKTPPLALVGLLGPPSKDSSPAVRSAAAAVRLAVAGQGADAGASLARELLADPDPGVRTEVLGWLAEHPVVPLEPLRQALTTAVSQRIEEEALGALDALVARGKAEPLERGGVVLLLESLTRGQAGYALRRQAGVALGDLERPVPSLAPIPEAEIGRNVEAYRAILQSTWQLRTVEILTSKGTIRLRLACSQAPLTCLNFLQLAGQGFYDGLLFHRVVPDFVVQGGDPRGDGFGGPGYDIRDEINRLRYRRGVAGMALAGADTGGSQFFLTLSEQPHLDGGYTAFGEVVAGDEVLDRLVPGDRIEKVAEVP